MQTEVRVQQGEGDIVKANNSLLVVIDGVIIHLIKGLAEAFDLEGKNTAKRRSKSLS